MGDKYYASQKFGQAVRHLATSDGTRREVLRGAVRHFSPISEEDFPPDSTAIEEFRSLMSRLTSAPDTTGEGTLIATLALMDEGEARALAGIIVDIDFFLTREIIEAQRGGEIWGKHH